MRAVRFIDHIVGGGRHAWQGACVAGEACMAGGLAWPGGGVRGRGCAKPTKIHSIHSTEGWSYRESLWCITRRYKEFNIFISAAEGCKEAMSLLLFFSFIFKLSHCFSSGGFMLEEMLRQWLLVNNHLYCPVWILIFNEEFQEAEMGSNPGVNGWMWKWM